MQRQRSLFNVPTFSLTVEIKAVVHALHWAASGGERPPMPSSSQIQWACYKQKSIGSQSLACVSVWFDVIHLGRLLWMFTVWRLQNDRADSLKWLVSWKVWIVEELELLPADTDMALLITWSEERGIEREGCRWASIERWEGATASQMNIGTFSKTMLVKLKRDGVEHIWAFSNMLIELDCSSQGG